MNILKDVNEKAIMSPDLRSVCFFGLGSGYEKQQNPQEAARNYLLASANEFIRFKRGSFVLHNVISSLEKAKRLGEGTTKGDAELLSAAIYRLQGTHIAIPQGVISCKIEPLKDALKGQNRKMKIAEDEIDFMIECLVHDLRI